MTKNTNANIPFRNLELQLKLDEIEEKWENAKRSYIKKEENALSTDEMLKLTVEKIRILAEYNLFNYEA